MARFSELSNPECDRCHKPIFGIYINDGCCYDSYRCSLEVYCSDCVNKAQEQNKRTISPKTRLD